LGFADSFRTFLNTTSNIIGAIVLISIIFPWSVIASGVVFVLYAMAATFYRASARETKVRASQTSGDLLTETFPAARRYPAVVVVLPFL
jgi:hypothetical protein